MDSNVSYDSQLTGACRSIKQVSHVLDSPCTAAQYSVLVPVVRKPWQGEQWGVAAQGEYCHNTAAVTHQLSGR